MSDNKTRIIVMGSGGSGGVPYAGNVWGNCNPANPRNQRTRPSLYIEKNDTRVVIDTGPDFRLQLNRTGMTQDQLLNAVLYTHTHFDHIMGLDDLRTFWFRSGKKPMPVYASAETLRELTRRFDYAFEPLDERYPATAKAHLLPKRLKINDLEIESFDQIHATLITTGFRIGDFAYCTDVNELPEASLQVLKGIKTWVVGSFPTEDGTSNHAGYRQIRRWIEILKPERTYLTHLTAQADYDTLCAELPPHIRPAYDGLEIMID